MTDPILDINGAAEIREMLCAVARAFGCLKGAYRPGVSCGELLSVFEGSLKKDVPGCSLQYDFICGADTAGIDGVTDANYVLRPGDAVLIDISVCRAGQWCDVTRTYFVGGYTKEQKETYGLVKKSIKAGEKALRAGTKAEDVYGAVNAVYAEAGKKLVHHAGHLIGEEPVMQPQFLAGKDAPVKAGNFYAIESGLYDGYGIRLENDYYVNESGAENLFEDLMPLEIEDYIL